MASPSNKKLLLLYVLKILNEFSDEEHPLTQERIAQLIYSSYGMEAERKAISANITCLADFGYDIQYIKNKGCYLGARTFEPSEVSFLVDAVFSSRFMDSRNAQDISGRIFGDFSRYQRKRYDYIFKADSLARSGNKQLFYTIDTINLAIEGKKQLYFEYISYNADRKKTVKPMTVSPYFLVNNGGRYYLVCGIYEGGRLYNYRVDRLENTAVVGDAKAIPISEIKGCENGLDRVKYANDNIYMFADKAVNATLCCKEAYGINFIFDWFGSDVRMRDEDGLTYAEVTVSEMALIYWALQYGETIEVVKPESTRRKIFKLASMLKDKYGDEA